MATVIKPNPPIYFQTRRSKDQCGHFNIPIFSQITLKLIQLLRIKYTNDLIQFSTINLN